MSILGLVWSFFEGIGLALGMAWETWWALVLGFTITGAVEEFVGDDRMAEYLGDDGLREVGYGTLFGSLSSSCSFSAVATAKTLFKKGASGVSSLAAFQFAATDLVAELGLVMWILLGWQFVAAEFVGGLIAVGVLAYLYRDVVPSEWFEVARQHALELDEVTCPACGMTADPSDDDTVAATVDGATEYFCCGGCLRAYRARNDADVVEAETADLRSLAGWKTAATNAIREWDMLWEDIALGFLLAGLIAAFVPDAWWTSLFGVGGEGSLTWVTVHVVLGVTIGVLTFLCSVGNVPFALVLWNNGVAFGAVLAFVFADLAIPQLVRTYRRYYGSRMAAVMFGATALAAVVAGVAVHYLFDFSGLIPAQGATGGATGPGAGYTLALNLLFTPLFLAQVGAAYGHERIGNLLVALPGIVGPYLYRAERAAGPTKAGLSALATGAKRFGRAMATAARRAADLLRALGRAVRVVGAAAAKAFDRFVEAYRRLRSE
ncbi:permease [Halorussus salinus]|uniref:permease n=1 Tax=Halorussus salinus TaxID=1364935 RepID=UPI001091D0FC|nr:permease [Halorussus salinus]